MKGRNPNRGAVVLKDQIAALALVRESGWRVSRVLHRARARLLPWLPYGQCFISHSYADSRFLRRIVAALPPHTKPMVLPLTDVFSRTGVTGALIHMIEESDSVVVAQTDKSANSPWVFFERDYALRAKKRVVLWDPRTDTFSMDVSEPPLLAVCPFGAVDAVGEILNLMRRERFVTLFFDSPRPAPPSDTDMLGARRLGGYVPPRGAGGGHERLLALQGGAIGVYFATSEADCDRLLDRLLSPRAFLHRDPPYTEGDVLSGCRMLIPRPETRFIIAAVTAGINLSRYSKRGFDVINLTDADGAVSINRVDDLIVKIYFRVYKQREQFPTVRAFMEATVAQLKARTEKERKPKRGRHRRYRRLNE